MLDEKLPELAARFGSVRGRPEDALWAATAASLLMMRGFDEKAVVGHLKPLVEGLQAAAPSAADTFGSPEDWSDEITERSAPHRKQSTPVSAISPLVQWLAAASGVVAALVGVELLFGKGTVPIEIPLVVGTAAATLVTSFNMINARAGRTKALVGTILLGLVVSGAILGIGATVDGAALTPARPLSWSVLVLAAAVCVVAIALRRQKRTAVSKLNNADPWIAPATAALHARGDFTNRDVRNAIREAAEFAAEAGTTLEEEFGSPTEFAASLPSRRRGPAAITETTALTIGCLAAVALYLRVTGAEGWDLLSLGLTAFLVAAAIAVVARRIRTARDPETST